MKKSVYQGFTLVELSIVLVIIGLLIGGILVAQSMIETAKVQTFIRQIQQFDIAIADFKTKYNSLPGDTSKMGCVNSGNTCDNGIIEDASPQGFAGSAFAFSGEIANFWPNLQQSGMASQGGGTFSNDASAGFTISGLHPNSPQMALGTNTGVVAFYAYSQFFMAFPPAAFAANGINYYLVGNFGSGVNIEWNGNDPGESIPVADALAIDKKIDDGLPNTDYNTNANVIDPTLAANQNSSINNSGSETCSNGNAYNISGHGNCNLIIKMLSTNGMSNP